MRSPRRCLVATSVLALASHADAAGLLADKGGRVVEESALVVWHGGPRESHVLFAGRATTARGAFVVLVPKEARLAAAVPGAPRAFAALAGEPIPLVTGSMDGPVVLEGDRRATQLCATLSVACRKEVAGFIDAATERAAIALGLAGVGGSDEGVTPYGHWVVQSDAPLAPFADPPGAPPEAESPDSAPRVTTWIELGLDTKTGAWERGMDEVVRRSESELAECWTRVAKGARGDVHVQLHLTPGKARSEGERASGPSTQKLARCYAQALEKEKWPDPPRATTVEVHAMVKPGAATKRTFRAFVLSTSDVEPRLGAAMDAVVPDLKVDRTFEPDPRKLADAFDAPTRAALGIDPSRRYRLVVMSTGADPHPDADIHFRPLAVPEPAPGETPLPIVEPGDRPDVTAKPTSLLRSKRLKIGVVVALLAVLLGWATWASRGKAREV